MKLKFGDDHLVELYDFEARRLADNLKNSVIGSMCVHIDSVYALYLYGGGDIAHLVLCNAKTGHAVGSRFLRTEEDMRAAGRQIEAALNPVVNL